MSRFDGKVALITGAGSGIGRATAELFASRGALLSISDLNETTLEETKVLCAKYTNQTLTTVCNVTSRSQLQNLVDRTIAKFNRIDILLPIAGVGAFPDNAYSDIKHFDFVINVNLRSVIELIQMCVPHLEKTAGNIVNVGSISGVKEFTDACFYGISKAGINHMTRTFAASYAKKKIRVNVVNPGIVRTNIIGNAATHSLPGSPALPDSFADKQGLDYWFDEEAPKMNLMGRVAEAREVAAAIAYLASDEAAFITGERLLIDGGNTLIGSTHLRRALQAKM